ncbi:hypothetical protein CONPUDRAFT_77200 [Coniophora puteana RWD-64-598 SS2]|uniref:Uncharacterized protein n=1 Tax=Coniophora puteana (strain RWD-64-598) TaxID=741705 RepID=A0A5M3M8C8_CONPW|nr:uncharacterized protein CONPUDRAFT_77200 [Coniophora puteana RWD-64-598 SS2]EIW75522.1 hypothetical protein CONPUDRAFT_77200 [Coniophora puteana RWD-64-598 SS2]
MTVVPLLPGSALNFDLLLDIISLAAKPDFSAFSRGENPYAGLASLCGIHSILRKDALRLLVHTVVLPTHRELVLFQQTLQAQKDRAITGLFPRLAFNYVGNVRRIFVGYLPIAPDLVFSSPTTDADERQAHDWAMSKASTLLDDSVLVPVLRAARDIAVDETALSLMKRLFRQPGTEDTSLSRSKILIAQEDLWGIGRNLCSCRAPKGIIESLWNISNLQVAHTRSLDVQVLQRGLAMVVGWKGRSCRFDMKDIESITRLKLVDHAIKHHSRFAVMDMVGDSKDQHMKKDKKARKSRSSPVISVTGPPPSVGSPRIDSGHFGELKIQPPLY